jgi:glycerol-3-phosphate dehydrogenase
MRKLERNLSVLSRKEYDLIIIGAGIFGVCAAWEAASRGLSVAIVDKGDFINATSANHFKMAHGGIRYLQHGDIPRVRESSRERSALLRIAPHLVKPLPIVIPTYGHGMKGKAFLGAGVIIYDFLTMDRNRGIQKNRMIPGGRFISRREVIELFPGIEKNKLTGGVVFCDGQIYNSPRLGLAFLRAAVEAGVDSANYVEVCSFLSKKSRINGIKARDKLNGEEFEIRAAMVLNTAGPWAHRVIESQLGLEISPRPTFSRDLAFVVKRKTRHDYGIAFSTKTKDIDTLIDRGGRHLFAVPWREYTLIGVWHRVYEGSPDEITVTEDEMQRFLQEVNSAFPSMEVSLGDILMINTGLTLFGSKDDQINNDLSFGKRSRLIDHATEHGLEGIVTLIGVRATMARGMASKAVDIISDKLKIKKKKSRTANIPIWGGDFRTIDDLIDDAKRECPKELKPEIINALIYNYGSKFKEILKYTNENPGWMKPLGDSTVLEAEIIHAVREEMAQKLTDVVFRRTELGSGGYCDEDALQRSAKLVAEELGWTEERSKQEMKETKQVFPQF